MDKPCANINGLSGRIDGNLVEIGQLSHDLIQIARSLLVVRRLIDELVLYAIENELVWDLIQQRGGEDVQSIAGFYYNTTHTNLLVNLKKTRKTNKLIRLTWICNEIDVVLIWVHIVEHHLSIWASNNSSSRARFAATKNHKKRANREIY